MKLLKEVVLRAKYSLGKMIRETGMGCLLIKSELERQGCQRTKDISYLEPLSRHRNIMGLYNQVLSK
jgi:hypothetical protein